MRTAFSVTDLFTISDLCASRETPTPAPLGSPRAPVTPAVLVTRLHRIAAMCTPGRPLYPIVAELRYLADVLDHLDKTT